MWLPFRLLFGEKAHYFYNFKEQAFELSEQAFEQVYEETASVHIQRETDLNQPCTDRILQDVKCAGGGRILEVGCGRGYLAGLLSENHHVTACDMHISDSIRQKHPKVDFVQGNIQSLPFEDAAFDTVVCTHTLEHVQNLALAIRELRRVTAKRLILVVPKQRPYKYTFDLHIHFFPYAQDFKKHLTGRSDLSQQVIENLGGDWYYQETLV